MASTASKSIRSFLSTAKSALSADIKSQTLPLTFVVGNEAADLDSLCSTILFAYLRTQTPPHRLHIPLANIPRADFALRPEFLGTFKHASLSSGEFPTIYDVPPTLRPDDARFLLVDHNALTGPLCEKFSSRIAGCVDHHVDEGKVPPDCGDEPRVIETAGSCSSLVVQHCRKIWDEHVKGEASLGLARLALAAILIDTTNLTDKNKTTHVDQDIVSYLETKLVDDTYDRDAYFQELTSLKEDLSNLSVRDMLRKDYKEWAEPTGKLGTSSIVKSVEYLVERAGSVDKFFEEVRGWAREREVDMACVMTTSNHNGQFSRQMILWGVTDVGARAAKEFEKNALKLEIEQLRDGELDLDGEQDWRRAWTQKNLASSRKQVAPLLRDAFSSKGKM